MDVAELIARLEQFPPDMTVTVDGYEGGVTERFELRAILVEPDANAGMEFLGEHSPLVLGPDEPIGEDVRLKTVLNLGGQESAEPGGLCNIAGCPEGVPADVGYCQAHADSDASRTMPLRI